MDVVLTGIKPTGTPHLGNYIGAIAPAIERAQNPGKFYFFIADYHALNYIFNPSELKQYTKEIAATWVALGLDLEKVVFYRQSDVPEIVELSWILSCATNKGLLNRAHAYKARVAENTQESRDEDFGVNMGLFSYPVLMSADILAFRSTLVPVGRDQFQHLEIARDIVSTFNSRYKSEYLPLPKALESNPFVLPGLDGRKMSKSYANTIPLFAEQKKLKKTINRITTDSSGPTEPKSTDCILFEIYKAFSSQDEITGMREEFSQGISWGAAKAAVFEQVDKRLSGPRETYKELMADSKKLEHILESGAAKARLVARETLNQVKSAAGFI